MKKSILLLLLLIGIRNEILAQSGKKWSLSGNSAGAGDFLRTSNASAATVIENGQYDLAEMDKALLQTVEENTLYIIELKKENDELKNALLKLEERILLLEGNRGMSTQSDVN